MKVIQTGLRFNEEKRNIDAKNQGFWFDVLGIGEVSEISKITISHAPNDRQFRDEETIYELVSF